MKNRKTLLLCVMLMGVFTLGASPSSAITRDLYIAATDGWFTLPDGFTGAGVPDTDPADPNRVYIRGFVGCKAPTGKGATFSAADCPDPGTAILPAPIIDVNQGDNVFIHLINIGNKNVAAAPDDHTIHLHGLHTTTQNDGFPETSFAAVVGGPPVTYYFYAEHPGTYMYHCHIEASEHVHAGMYGALIIRPVGYNPACPFVYTGLHNDNYDIGPDGRPQEFIMLITEFDTAAHRAIELGAPFYWPDFKPNYWLLNGRSFPDTIASLSADVGPAGLGAGPPTGHLEGSNNHATYQALINVFLGQKGRPEGFGRKYLLRFIGLGFQHTPFHLHGWHFRMVGKDAMPIPRSAQLNGEMTLNLASGSTYDVITSADCKAGVGLYSTNSLSPQVGTTPGEPAISPTDNVLKDQWYPIHDHHDYKVTNDGIYPGGALTLIHAIANPADGKKFICGGSTK